MKIGDKVTWHEQQGRGQGKYVTYRTGVVKAVNKHHVTIMFKHWPESFMLKDIRMGEVVLT